MGSRLATLVRRYFNSASRAKQQRSSGLVMILLLSFRSTFRSVLLSSGLPQFLTVRLHSFEHLCVCLFSFGQRASSVSRTRAGLSQCFPGIVQLCQESPCRADGAFVHRPSNLWKGSARRIPICKSARNTENGNGVGPLSTPGRREAADLDMGASSPARRTARRTRQTARAPAASPRRAHLQVRTASHAEAPA